MSSASHPEVDLLDSLPKFRKRHVELMRQSLERPEPSELISKVVDFVKRIEEFGTRIEAEDDRSTAQNMLDYWHSTLTALTKGAPMGDIPTELKPFVVDRSETAHSGDNPFSVNRVQGEVDRNLLRGREDAIHTVLQLIAENPIIFLSGPVGSGRSSLVMAGVAPRLAKTKNPLEVLLLSLHGDDPIRSLGKLIGRATAAD